MRTITLLLLVLMIGCKSPKVTTERYYSDTTIITEKVKLVTVPGVTMKSTSINIDSLVSKLKAGIPPSVIERETIYKDPVTGNQVGILIDQFGNLTALCEMQEQTIQLLEKEVLRLVKEKEVNTVLVKPNFFQRIKASIDLIVYTTLILLAVLFIIKRLLP